MNSPDKETLPSGSTLLRNPRLNKGSAFTADERRAFGIEGLLPPRTDTLQIQVARSLEQIERLDSDIQKYLFLSDLQSRNETLYFAVIMGDPARFMPIVYTPTVGEACQTFDRHFRGARGLYLPITARGKVREHLANWPEADVRFIVVTDGERILGLGDLGANGMGIPLGKLSLYTACAGVPPQYTLPVLLDVGTDNSQLREDPLYLGLPQERTRGTGYDDFVDEFVQAVQERFPLCCIQWEDFANINAVPILARYQDQICTFNDDIQGTAAVALAGIYAALRIKKNRITSERFLFLGAGSAGVGIAELLAEAMVNEGLTIDEARHRCWLFDVHGLLTSQRNDLLDFQRPFAHDHEPIGRFADAIRSLKPTTIIGVSTVPKLFDHEVIRTMAEINERPIIFPYSNPTSRSECTAEEAYRWTGGRAIFASGSPFPPVHLEGRTFIPGQGNNVYIFPAMGLAALATQTRRIPQSLFIRAAHAVAHQVTDSELASGLIYPSQDRILAVQKVVAARVAESIFDLGLARVERPADIRAHIESIAYQPTYPTYA